MKLLIPNKKVNFNYHIIDTYECGIVLTGNEVKSLAQSNGNIDEAFCIIKKEEMYVINMYIPPFVNSSKIEKYVPDHKRKLLLHKSEIEKIDMLVKKQKLTIIPTKVYFSKDNIKIEIALARHKKLNDKRQDIKARDLSRVCNKYS
ncbi:MAG: SsrA-binding protein [Mycoplasmataceae bacterium]|jgi:SsrA-binding protein|nr:SsrA-binding protein [Mycoplasmataceae bacterium]